QAWRTLGDRQQVAAQNECAAVVLADQVAIAAIEEAGLVTKRFELGDPVSTVRIDARRQVRLDLLCQPRHGLSVADIQACVALPNDAHDDADEIIRRRLCRHDFLLNHELLSPLWRCLPLWGARSSECRIKLTRKLTVF